MMKSDLWVSQHTLLETFKIMGGYLYSGNLGFEEAADIDACIALAQSLRAQTGNNAQYDTLFLDEIKDIYSHIDHYRILEKRLEDDRSKQVLDHLLMFRLTRNDQYLMEAFCPDDRQYFSSNFVIYRKPGVFVDCGCLDGASTLEYIDCVPSFHHVYAFEPMHEMNAVCRRNLDDYLPDRITLLEKAVSDEDGIMYFDNAIEGSSHLSETGSVTIETTSLDNAIQESIDYLKMDIEGAEMAALHGAEGHIRNEHPVLAICVYHRPEDLHAIFEYIEGLYPNYKYYLRHHMMDANETVLYAIPEDLNQSNTFHVASEKQNLRDLLLKEFTRVQKTNLEYIRFLLSLIENYRSSQSATLDGYRSLEENYHTALRELEYYQSQYKTEQEAHAYFEQQYLAEQKEREFYQLQYKAEQEAHAYFEQQYLSEQKEREFYQLQYKAKQEAHAYFEQQYLAEQKEHEFYQLQYKAEQEAHAYFEQQYLSEQKEREFYQLQYKAEQEAHA